MSYLDLARGRYSCREFQDRSVEQAVVDAIVEAGRIAPSACNNHPSRVMVLDTPELLEKAAACQPRFARDGSIFGAPLIFLICSVEKRGLHRYGIEVQDAVCPTEGIGGILERGPREATGTAPSQKNGDRASDSATGDGRRGRGV